MLKFLSLRLICLAVILVSGLTVAASAPRGEREVKLVIPPRPVAKSGLSRPVGNVPVPNFGEVIPGFVYRSGQPGTKGWGWLKQLGIRSIVCLRKEHDDGADAMAGFGFRYLYLPITDQHAPSPEQADSFLQFASDPANWPLLVHCEAGAGRAGTMAALTRYAFDDWPMSRALREARNYRPIGFPMFGSQLRFLERWERTHPRGQLRTVLLTPFGSQ